MPGLKCLLAAGTAVVLFAATVQFSPAIAAEPDQLKSLSSDFQSDESLKSWSEHTVEGFTPKWKTPRVEDGHLVLEPKSAGWFEDMQGGHLYREVDGNFIVTARMRVQGTKAQLPQTLFSLAGLFVRAPREGLTAANWEAGKEDWLFFSLGSAYPAGSSQFEIKTTYDSLSTLKISDASAVYADNRTRFVDLRIARQGELFSLLYRIEGQETFTLLDQFIRPDLPAKLNVGVTAYADWASNASVYPDFTRYNTSPAPENADLIARIDSIEFRRPTVDRFPVASFEVSTSFMPEISQKRIDDLIRK